MRDFNSGRVFLAAEGHGNISTAGTLTAIGALAYITLPTVWTLSGFEGASYVQISSIEWQFNGPCGRVTGKGIEALSVPGDRLFLNVQQPVKRFGAEDLFKPIRGGNANVSFLVVLLAIEPIGRSQGGIAALDKERLWHSALNLNLPNAQFLRLFEALISRPLSH